jgi:hypothetical protein
MIDYQDWLSLREIDQAGGTSKGAAFRAFRDIEAGLKCDLDFVLLHHVDDAEAIAALRASGRIYPGSINVVLLRRSVGHRMIEALRSAPSTQQ